MEESTQHMTRLSKDKFYHAVDGDSRRLVDAFGIPIIVQVIGFCDCQKQAKCQDITTKKTLWFFPSSLRESKEDARLPKP